MTNNFLYKKIKPIKRKIVNLIYNNLQRLRLKKKNFVIISNNCWGGDVYESLGIKYNTPFVGLFIYAPCYIMLLKNFNEIVHKEVKFIPKSKYKEKIEYPIGLLDDNIEIHFLHYKSIDEAKSKWDRRIKRLKLNTDLDNYYFKYDDTDLGNNEILNDFHNLPYKNKISFTRYSCGFKNNFFIDTSKTMVLLATTTKIVDVVYWINNGIIKNTKTNKFISFLFPLKKMWM
jgi:uncharacterized protein (DUF1919 family)